MESNALYRNIFGDCTCVARKMLTPLHHFSNVVIICKIDVQRRMPSVMSLPMTRRTLFTNNRGGRMRPPRRPRVNQTKSKHTKNIPSFWLNTFVACKGALLQYYDTRIHASPQGISFLSQWNSKWQADVKSHSELAMILLKYSHVSRAAIVEPSRLLSHS